MTVNTAEGTCIKQGDTIIDYPIGDNFRGK